MKPSQWTAPVSIWIREGGLSLSFSEPLGLWNGFLALAVLPHLSSRPQAHTAKWQPSRRATGKISGRGV